MAEADLLQHVPIFAALEVSERLDLAKSMRKRTYQRGDILFHRDDYGSLLYCIMSGRIRIFLPTGFGEEVTLDILNPGEVFGELAVFDEMPRSASAIAVEDVTVLTLDRQQILAWLAQHPKAMDHILSGLSQRIRQANRMIEDIITLDVPGRICKKLLQLSEEYGTSTPEGIHIGIRFTQQELASMIGATRESTNKVLRNFQSRGVIQMDGQNVKILRPELLRQRITFSSTG